MGLGCNNKNRKLHIQQSPIGGTDLQILGVPMDEGIEKDNTSGGGGLPTLPGLNLSTIQPSRQGFYRIHVCEGEDNWRQYI